MKPKLLLGLALVLSGGLIGSAGTPIPPIETAQDTFSEPVPNEWAGRTFSEILPPQQIKRILPLDDADFRNPFFLSKPSAQETQNYYNQLFEHLECSGEKTSAPYLAGNEMTRAQFAVITSSGDVLRVQALSKMVEDVSSVLISGHGIEARIDIKDFRPSLSTSRPAVAAKQTLPEVETHYLLDQKPGDWAGLRFGQIISPGKIKRIILLEQIANILDYGPTAPLVDSQRGRQMCYESLFDRFETSNQKAGTNSMSKDECGFAKLILITDSGEVIYLEIVGALGRIENGSVVGSHIAGVLIHGSGKGVRIDLDILPATSAIQDGKLPPADDSPLERSSAQRAVETALNFIRTNQLNTAEYKMTAPEAIQRVPGEGATAWRVSWQHRIPAGAAAIAGGQLVIVVHDSGKIERVFSE
jgi:hypothetical protein